MPPSWDLDHDTLGNDYISYDDSLRDVRDYPGVLDFTADIPANHENARGVSVDPQVQGLIDHDLVRRDLGGFIRGSITAKWKRSVSRAKETFTGSRASYSKKGDRYPQQQKILAQRRHAACCCRADGRVTLYRRVRPNNNNNNNTALAEFFSQVRCTSCDNWVSTPTQTRRILRISLMPRWLRLKSPT